MTQLRIDIIKEQSGSAPADYVASVTQTDDNGKNAKGVFFQPGFKTYDLALKAAQAYVAAHPPEQTITPPLWVQCPFGDWSGKAEDLAAHLAAVHGSAPGVGRCKYNDGYTYAISPDGYELYRIHLKTAHNEPPDVVVPIDNPVNPTDPWGPNPGEDEWNVEYIKLEPSKEAFQDPWATSQVSDTYVDSWASVGEWETASAEAWGVSVSGWDMSAGGSFWGEIAEWFGFGSSDNNANSSW
jgi:hypothetical protein